MSQSQIVDDLLDLTRVRTGKLLLNCAPSQLNLMLDNIVGVFRKEAAAKEIELVYEAPDEPVAAFADSVRVEQIIWNLLGNALKFTPQGGRVSVRLSKEDGGARLEIADTGAGINPDLLPHIFDMFRQADSRTTRQHGGLGIGLALVRHLTELHGGRVSATSAGLGRGATFTVWLPVYSEVLPALPGSTGGKGMALASKKILLVDDAAQASQGLVDLLSLEDIDVTVTKSPAEALRLVQTKHIDLILSDISMPEMDGYQFLAELRKLPNTATLPVIAMTSYTRPKEVRKIMQAGFDAWVAKPLVIEKLFEAVMNVLKVEHTIK